MKPEPGKMLCAESKHSNRCALCNEYPEKSDQKCVAAAIDHHNFGFIICRACINKLNETILLDVVPPETSSR